MVDLKEYTCHSIHFEVQQVSLGPIVPKVALLTSYSFVASPFEKEVCPRTSILVGCLLVFPLARTVVMRAGNGSEHLSEQLF